MNAQNEEDIPTRNFKKEKKNNKNILNWRQTTFHVEQKQKKKKKKGTKQKKTNKKKQKTKNNNNKKTKKNPSETPRKIFQMFPAELTSGKQNWTWNFFQQKHYQHTFLLPNLQNKVTFFKLSLTLLLFRFLSPHGLSLPLPH